jgi:hypothetical protein
VFLLLLFLSCSTFFSIFKNKLQSRREKLQHWWISLPFQPFLLVWRNCTFHAEFSPGPTYNRCLHNPSLAVIIMRFHSMSKEKKHLLDKAFYCLRFTFISGNEERKGKNCFHAMVCHDQMICFSG